MVNELKKSAPAYLGIFGIALIVAALARVGLAVMDSSGVLSYNYRAATQPYGTNGLSTLDQLPMTMTGGTFIGFIFAGGLALCLAVAAVLVFAHLFNGANEGKLGTALVWGFVTALVSFACLIIVVLGLYSRVLLFSMTSSSGGGLGLTLGLLFLCVGTLIAAACTVFKGAVAGNYSVNKKVVRALVAALVCGAVVCVLVVGSFGAINAYPANTGGVLGWMLAAIVLNCVLLFAGSKLAQK